MPGALESPISLADRRLLSRHVEPFGSFTGSPGMGLLGNRAVHKPAPKHGLPSGQAAQEPYGRRCLDETEIVGNRDRAGAAQQRHAPGKPRREDDSLGQRGGRIAAR